MIRIESLSKSFQQQLVLDAVSMHIPAGQIFGLLGPNGAGKTTLIRIINQMLPANDGQIYLNGQALQKKHLSEIGYLPEERGLYKNMRVGEQLLFFAQLRGFSRPDALLKVRYWLDRFDIRDWEHKRLAALSKGMAQKIQFIAALVHDPSILILDEPLSGFDPVNVDLIMNEMKALKAQGKTIILSTHNMKSVDEICDRAALLHQGKKIAEDSVWNLRDAHDKGQIIVRFKGHMLGFANALWTDFELLEQHEISEGRFECVLGIRGQQRVNDLMRALQDKVEVERIEKRLPSMQEVFIDSISGKEGNHA
ncbi:MAG: hypothetical protein RLZZ301_720 [Bacteroidota bacterium]|jgi:ABC-2 type transport system ATP-binding protein